MLTASCVTKLERVVAAGFGTERPRIPGQFTTESGTDSLKANKFVWLLYSLNNGIMRALLARNFVWVGGKRALVADMAL